MKKLALLAVILIKLHTPNGHLIAINPAEISSMREPIDGGRWTRGVHCVIVMANGRVNAVAEDCLTVMKKLQ